MSSLRVLPPGLSAGSMALSAVAIAAAQQPTKRPAGLLNMRNTALADGFVTVDVGAGYRFRRVEVRVDGRNLSNRRDAVSESEFGDAQYYRMTARSVQVGLLLNY